MSDHEQIAELVKPIRDDLLSGAAEIALRAITIFQTVMNDKPQSDAGKLKEKLVQTARALIDAQPAMAPVFHLCNGALMAIEGSKTVDDIQRDCQVALDKFEKRLCESAALIADLVDELIPPGELIFAYSFSSTVVSCLLNARAKGHYFRVACTEARPSMEGRKLATRLAAGNIEVIHTFDNAMGLVLPNCSVAFMGCDCVGKPGVVNKVGSWTLAVSCKEMGIPLYALAGTEKFVSDDRLFEFENHERPGEEVWESAPKGVRVLNHQFELVPFNLLTGVVTERGILKEPDIDGDLSGLAVHEALKLHPATFYIGRQEQCISVKPVSIANRYSVTSLLLACLGFQAIASEARLGEDFQSYKRKLEHGWKFKGRDKKDVRTYYMYSMDPDKATMDAAPGFTGGLTLTVVQGRIAGQSMVIRLGDSAEVGRELAAAHALDFAYEALAKPAPKSKEATRRELDAYAGAIGLALLGRAQNIRYPGFNAKITLSKTGDGDLLIAVTPAVVTAQPGTPAPVHTP